MPFVKSFLRHAGNFETTASFHIFRENEREQRLQTCVHEFQKRKQTRQEAARLTGMQLTQASVWFGEVTVLERRTLEL